MNKAAQLVRDWMLPAALLLGVGLYLGYHSLGLPTAAVMRREVRCKE